MKTINFLTAALIVTIVAAQTTTPCAETDCNYHAASVSGDLITGCTCTCATGYAGATCNTCAAGSHGYPACVSCDTAIDGSSTVTTVAGDAEFSSPSGVVGMLDGSIAVSDTNNHRIRLVAPDGTVTTLAGSGVAGYADGPGLLSRFNLPYGVALMPSGSIAVGDADNNRIRLVARDGTTMNLAGCGMAGFADGRGTAAMFNYPQGVAVLPSGSVVVADSRNNRVRVVAPDGTATTLAGNGNRPGPHEIALFYDPVGVAALQNGAVVVIDRRGSELRLVAPDRTVSVVTTGDASFNSPMGVGVLHDGRIVIADANDMLIRLLTPDGAVTTLAGSGANRLG